MAIRQRVFSPCMVLVLVASALLAGCAGRNFTIAVTESELAALVTPKFPIEHRVAQLLDVKLQSPQLRLLTDVGRLGLDVQVRVAERLGGRALTGKVALDGVLRLEPKDHTLRFSKVRVGQVRIDGLAASAQGAVDQVVPSLAEKALEDTVVYRFKEEDLKTAAKFGLTPKGLQVTPKGLEITIGPPG